MEEKTLQSTLVYEGRILDVFEDDVLISNGIKAKRVLIKHNGAAAILPITKDNKIILTRQYRYPIHQVTLEIPAGKLDSKEEPSYDCAKRELEEETGYNSNDISFYLKIHNALGYSDEFIDIYIAKDCFEVEHPLNHDEDEVLENVIVTLEEALNLIENGSITDAKSIIALYKYASEVTK